MMNDPTANSVTPPDKGSKAVSGGFSYPRTSSGAIKDPLAAADQSFKDLEGVQYSLRERRTVTVSLPQGWARAALAGVEAALFGWVIPTLGFLLAYLAVSANPWLKDFQIGEAARMGTQFWASSLGADIVLGSIPITFVPLTWTLLQIVALRVLLLTGREFDSAALWTAMPAFLATTAVILALGAQAPLMVPALIGALVVSLLGTLWALARQTERFPKWMKRLPWLWSGIKMGLLWLGITALGSLVLVGISVAASWDGVQSTRDLLTGGGLAGAALAALEIMYLPVFGAWALAWVSGAGFSMVGGSLYSALVEPTGAEPFMPIVAAVPTTAPGSWVPVALGIFGLALGLLGSVQTARYSLTNVLYGGGAAVATFTLVVFVWMRASSGALGVAALAVLGPTPWAWAQVSALVGVVAFVVMVLVHPQTRRIVRERFARRSAVVTAEEEVS